MLGTDQILADAMCAMRDAEQKIGTLHHRFASVTLASGVAALSVCCSLSLSLSLFVYLGCC